MDFRIWGNYINLLQHILNIKNTDLMSNFYY